MKRAYYIVEAKVFIRHTAKRTFIGPGVIWLENGELLMASPWGRPPTNFEQLAATFPVPPLFRSSDGGRTWQDLGPMDMAWDLTGMISDGGISFLYLQDGRLAFLAHRHVQGQHGGGLPVISFSKDHGKSWTPARIIGAPEGVWYVMNDRLIQMAAGRLVVPVAHMSKGTGTREGDRCLGLCFFSDDSGETWRRSRTPADLADIRGMAEPCVAEVDGERLLMLARTGAGCIHASWSDDGGDTWSSPEPTTLTSPCSALTLKTLPDGRLIVFYNHTDPVKPGSFFPRTPLCYAVSEDGRSWSEPVLVDESGVLLQDRQNVYPGICFTGEGMVVVYSAHLSDSNDQAGNLDRASSHTWPDCGGKCCILAYPE